MGHIWKKSLLLTVYVVLTSGASMSTKLHESSLSNNCKNSTSLDCKNNSEKLLKKRQTLITLENVATCNATRTNCIRNCPDIECMYDCPVCPNMRTVSGMKHLIIEGANDSYVHDSPIKGTNVTTVIKLVNLINNTNVIDIPTNVNLTNRNHVHIYHNESSDEGGEFGLGYNRFGSCCIVVQPKSCTPTSRGYSCHHKRHKTCGQQCTSRIMHADSRSRCTSDRKCTHKISYIPQPRKPRCVYTSKWPYVSCGGHHQQNCHGCYEHYGYGAHSYYGGRIPSRCHACYDDSFDMGQLYRRGPVFRPFFYHQPPCYLTGTCHMSFCGMYGCFGNEYINPAWGYFGGPQMHMVMEEPYSQMYRRRFHSQVDSSIFAETFPDYVEIEDSLPHLPPDGADWGVAVHKCNVVANNGTVKKCIDTEWERNPFAASPSVSHHQPVESSEESETYEVEENLKRYITDNPPSAYEQFEENQWDNEISYPQRNLHRRHARKHQILYDE